MYLSRIHVKHFRGIKEISVDFHKSINVVIGENGSCKSALLDAIRILYNFAAPSKDIYIKKTDFYIDPVTRNRETTIEIIYEFRGLTEDQKGAFYEYLVLENHEEDDFAKVCLRFDYREDSYPTSDYYTGAIEGQKARTSSFEQFQHYYLDALRDSTRDLLKTRKSILGSLILRTVKRQKSEEKFEKIILTANKSLLEKREVRVAQGRINQNLEKIYKQNVENQIGLRLDDPDTESFIHSLRPYLPFDVLSEDGGGFELAQNSLGFNNLLYIATILGDIRKRVSGNTNTHFVLLIEEPEAHLHPQLQLSLYNFLTDRLIRSTQIFITSHSPTLTSKIPLESLITLDGEALTIDSCFSNRIGENLREDTKKIRGLKQEEFTKRKRQLERYLDVTKSQLFFSKSLILVEGICEELLIPAFCRLKNFNLEDYRIELVNLSGTSFYPLLHLFNSTNEKLRLKKKVAVITDDDRFTDSKISRYSFNELNLDNALIDELYTSIRDAKPSNRIDNLELASNGSALIKILPSYKTFEYELCLANVSTHKSKIEDNFLVQFFKNEYPDSFKLVKSFFTPFGENLTLEQRHRIAILIWKSIPSKAEFAQDFSLSIIEALDKSQSPNLAIPKYIDDALKFVSS